MTEPYEFQTVSDPGSWQRAAIVCIIVSLVTVLAAFGVLGYKAVKDGQEDDNESTALVLQAKEIAELRSQVARLGLVDAERDAVTRCLSEHTGAVAETQSIVLLGLVDALVAVGSDDDRLLREAIDELKITRIDYRRAVNARIAYEENGNPLPCPFKNGD